MIYYFMIKYNCIQNGVIYMKKILCLILAVLTVFPATSILSVSASASEIVTIKSVDNSDDLPLITSQDESTTEPEETSDFVEETQEFSQSTDSPEETGETTESVETSEDETDPPIYTESTESSGTEGSEFTEPTEKKTTIVLPSSSIVLYIKGTFKIYPKINNPKGKTTYKSQNPDIASVDSEGKITARKKGTTKITVTNNSVSKSLQVTVKAPYLDKAGITLGVGESYKIKIYGQIGEASFSSSSKSVATVNSNGTITAKKPGSARITIKTNGVRLSAVVKVKTPAINKKSVGVFSGRTFKLKISGTKAKIKWTSSNNKIAKVSSAGAVTAKKAGKATITAKIGSYKLKCKVFVYTKTKYSKNKVKLKNYIIENGITNANGDKVINYQREYSGFVVQAGIVYNAKTDRFDFLSIFYMEDDSAIAVAMPVTINDKGTVKVYSMFESTSSGVAYDTYAKLNVEKYDGKSNLKFKKVNSPYINNSDVQSLSNDTLKISCNAWENILVKQAGLSMKKIGFKSLKK